MEQFDGGSRDDGARNIEDEDLRCERIDNGDRLVSWAEYRSYSQVYGVYSR